MCTFASGRCSVTPGNQQFEQRIRYYETTEMKWKSEYFNNFLRIFKYLNPGQNSLLAKMSKHAYTSFIIPLL